MQKMKIKELSFATQSDFLILMSLQPNVGDLSNFKLIIIKKLKYHRFTLSGCEDIGTIAKTHFLCKQSL